MGEQVRGAEAELTGVVIGAAFEVANVLGAGFLEKVYERGLLRELTLRGLTARTQAVFPVCYKGARVGEYIADVVVGDELIVELKCVERFSNEHVAKVINYLKASGLRIALMINFQRPKIEWKRVALTERFFERRGAEAEATLPQAVQANDREARVFEAEG